MKRFLVRFLTSSSRPLLNHYKTLGISESCSAKEIKAAYYELSKKYHPDICKQGSDTFIKIKDAYEVLGNDEKRRLYHQSLHLSNHPMPFKDFSGWTSPTSEHSTSTESNASNSYGFRRQVDLDSAEISGKQLGWILGLGCIAFTGAVFLLIAFYEALVEDKPSVMNKASEEYRSKAFVLEFNPMSPDSAHQVYYRKFEPGPQWIGKKPPEYPVGATR
jgi:curved DNA-binding protein CbpA